MNNIATWVDNNLCRRTLIQKSLWCARMLNKLRNPKITVDNPFKHYVFWCSHCERYDIICGLCDNNACNGGYGEVDGKECHACPSAYEIDVHKNNILEVFIIKYLFPLIND